MIYTLYISHPFPSPPLSNVSPCCDRASRERRLVSELKSLGLLHGPQTDVHVHLDLTKLYGMGLFRHLPNPAEGLPMHNLFGLFAETDGESDRSVRVVYILSRQQQRLPALPRDEWFTVDKILAEYRYRDTQNQQSWYARTAGTTAIGHWRAESRCFGQSFEVAGSIRDLLAIFPVMTIGCPCDDAVAAGRARRRASRRSAPRTRRPKSRYLNLTDSQYPT